MLRLVNVQTVDVPQYMSITDASKLFGLSKYYLRTGIKSGAIKHTIVGNKYMIDTGELQKQLQEKEKRT
jgi:excisionase family DNA binding protein